MVHSTAGPQAQDQLKSSRCGFDQSLQGHLSLSNTEAQNRTDESSTGGESTSLIVKEAYKQPRQVTEYLDSTS